MTKTAVSFIIPILHPENARDWGKVCRDFSETIASLCNQSSDNWTAVVIANESAQLPEVPDKISIVRVDFPPNEKFDIDVHGREAGFRAIQFDKGRRFLAGALTVKDSASYLMTVDADDFIHRDLVQFVEQHMGEPGWKFRQGYMWAEGSAYMAQPLDFSTTCGTSLMIRTDLYDLPGSLAAADPDYLRNMLGGHKMVQQILGERGHKLADLPFPGAVYRAAHAGSHSKSPSPFKLLVWNRHYMARPIKMLNNLRKFRFLGKRLKAQYGMPV